MTWTPKDEAERAAVAALCVEAMRKRSDSNFDYHSDGGLAERIVPPVPRVLREYKGVTYRDEMFRTSHHGVYATAAELINYNDLVFTDEDHAALLDLKANPTVTPRKKLDPEEVLAKMYGQQEAIETATAQYNAAAKASLTADERAITFGTDTPPTRERVEPEFWCLRFADGVLSHFTKDSAEAKEWARSSGGTGVRTAVPLYRHPATIDDAIALLVREGAVRDQQCVAIGNLQQMDIRHIIILPPTPERAS